MCTFMYVCMYVETLGLSMELNDDILVQTTSLQTIARVKRITIDGKCFMLHKVAYSVASFAPIFVVFTISLA